MVLHDNSSIDSDVQKLLEKYPALPLLHQRILQIRSLIFNSERKADFLGYLVKSDLRIENSGKLYKADFRIILGRLIEAGFLDADSHQHLKIIHHIAVLATSNNNPYTKENLVIVKKVLNIKDKLDFLYGINWSHHQNIYVAIYANDATLFINNQIVPIKYFSFLLGIMFRLFYVDGLDIDWLKTRQPIRSEEH